MGRGDRGGSARARSAARCGRLLAVRCQIRYRSGDRGGGRVKLSPTTTTALVGSRREPPPRGPPQPGRVCHTEPSSTGRVHPFRALASFREGLGHSAREWGGGGQRPLRWGPSALKEPAMPPRVLSHVFTTGAPRGVCCRRTGRDGPPSAPPCGVWGRARRRGVRQSPARGKALPRCCRGDCAPPLAHRKGGGPRRDHVISGSGQRPAER